MIRSTEIDSIASHVGTEKAIELVAKAGFDAWDFSLFPMLDDDKNIADHPLNSKNRVAYVRELRKIGEECGIFCNQSHAACYNPSHYNDEYRELYKRSIECVAEAGGKIIVIHPDVFYATREQNLKMYEELLPTAKEFGVKIAAENLWIWNGECAEKTACSDHIEYKAYMDGLQDEYFIACLDIGHAEMRGLNTSSVEMINTLGSRLQALHIHDNELGYDLHGMPFTMKIDFEAIVKALRANDYKGDFTMEAATYIAELDRDKLFDGLVALRESADKLVSMYEEK